jgi:8-oxo-dGTP diphosphatase
MGKISIGATAVVVKDGKVLLTKRRDYPVWVLPGGAIEFGESPDQAAVRETLEETGLVVEVTRLIGVYTRVSAADRTDHGFAYLAEIRGGTLTHETSETRDAAFFPPDALPRDTVWWHRTRIVDAVAGQVGQCVYQYSGYPGGAETREDLEKEMRLGNISVASVVDELCEAPGNHTEIVRLSGISCAS